MNLNHIINNIPTKKKKKPRAIIMDLSIGSKYSKNRDLKSDWGRWSNGIDGNCYIDI